ncbi:hypothetical protein LJ707_01490 [Mucilaginibacter sp. UR6-1]|uniref:hypothetical protein n=1 Tax=Mucilaginibacter sp. UR6-1 TaxID=1435643 RepID=UPI001E316189|nr:hypothetical protein [Mucilaginibacter sp. UR6-1]MCC8407585.1 hypothetical protein [Mucilaginibacter sp. UR6-1]
MINPATFNTSAQDGTIRKLIIEPVLKRDNNGELADTGVYRLLKNSTDNDSFLFTEPLETTESNTDIPDTINPDYLGKITFANGSWAFEGDLLTEHEQQQVAGFIIKHA